MGPKAEAHWMVKLITKKVSFCKTSHRTLASKLHCRDNAPKMSRWQIGMKANISFYLVHPSGSHKGAWEVSWFNKNRVPFLQENGDAKLHILCSHPTITLAFYLLFIFLMEQFPTTALHRIKEPSLGYKASGAPRNTKRGGRQLVREHRRELCACALGSSEVWAAFHEVKQRRWLGKRERQGAETIK